MDARGRDAARVVRRRGGRPRAGPVERPRRQPVGVAGRPRRRRPGLVARLAPRLGARRRRVRRPARRRVRLRRAGRPARRGIRPEPPDRRRQLRRRGGRPLRRRLRRIAHHHRRAGRRPGPRAHRRRRHDAWPRRCGAAGLATAPPRPRRRDAAPHRRLRRTARRAGPRAGRPRPAGRRRQRDPPARPLAHRPARARPTTPAPRALGRPAATRCSPLAARSCSPRAGGRAPRRRRHLRQAARSRPTASTPSPSHVTAWLDARAATEEQVRAVVADVARAVEQLGGTRAPRSRGPRPPPSTSRSRSGSPPCSTTRRCSTPAPATTPASSRRPASRPPCCSSATPPASRTRRPSTPSATTAWPGSRPSPRGRRLTWLRVTVPGSPRRRCCRTASAAGTSASTSRTAGSPPSRPARRPATRAAARRRPARLRQLHSHAFHRALRGRTHAGGGTFWTWREQHVRASPRASTRTPTSRWPARPTPRWRWPASPRSGSSTTCTTPPAAGPTPSRTRWPRRWSRRPREAGLRLTLLDACYLAGGLDAGGHRPLDEVQRRFADAGRRRLGGTGRGARRARARPGRRGGALGARRPAERAAHRGAGGRRRPAARPPVRAAGRERGLPGACYGRTPTALLADAGALGPATTAVHATHLTERRRRALGRRAVTTLLLPDHRA